MDYRVVVDASKLRPGTAGYQEAMEGRRLAAFGLGAANALNNAYNPIRYGVKDGEGKGEVEVITLRLAALKSFYHNGYKLPHIHDLQKRLVKKIKISSINQTQYNPQDKDSTNATDVVETWGNEAWSFTIRGLLINQTDHGRPLELIQEFATVVKQNVLFDVEGPTFAALGVTQVYMEEVEINPVAGFQDTEAYIILARSYTPLNLELS